MRKIIMALVLLVTACHHTEKEERILTQGKNDALMVMDVPKARCKKCQRIIEDGLLQEEGVQQSILDLNTKRVSIIYQPEKITPKTLQSSIDKLVQKIPCK